MLRQVIYILAAAAAAGTVGYAIGLESAGAGNPSSAAGAPTASPATAPAAPASGIDWTRISDQDLAVAQVFLTLRDVGVEAALDSLQLLAARDPEISRRGHQLAHALGRAAIARAGDDPAALARCRPLFQAGCYHGVLEGYLASVERVDAQRLTGMCAALARPGEAVISARECAHGLGHGLLERVGYDFGVALRACDAFRSDALKEECHDGIFMQNLVNGEGLPTTTAAESSEADSHQHGNGETHAAHASGAGFRSDDLTYPCSTVGRPYQPSCWSYQPVAIRRFLGDPGPRTMISCDLAPEDARARCYAGYGKQTLSRYGNDLNAMIQLCGVALPPHDDQCLGGVVEVLVDREWGAGDALAFCERVALSAREAAPCYRMVGERVSLLHAASAETEAACAGARDPRFVTECVAGGRR
jgi:hypothetical protein